MTNHPARRYGQLALLYLTASLLTAQQYSITTYAGGTPPATPAIATSASIGLPGGIAVDVYDNVFFSGEDCLFRLDTKGVLTRVAGNSRPGYSGDGGPAVNAQFLSPNSVAVDGSGNLYTTDEYRVRRVSAAGIVTTVAGNGTAGSSGDGGSALAAQINAEDTLAADNAGNLYLGDYLAGVRKVSAAGIITTVAGNGTAGYSGDGGPATRAQLNGVEGVAMDSAGNLYIADAANFRVRRVSPGGTITTYAGNGILGDGGDGGPAAAAEIESPDGIALDRNGNLYIATASGFRVRKVSPAGVISTVYAGSQTAGALGPIGLGADSAGNVYLADVANHRVDKISAAGTVSTAAGDGYVMYSGDGGPAIHAQLFGPQAVALDRAGDLYIADSYNSRIRRVSATGVITTVAGNGTYGYAGDGGLALNAEFYDPWALALDGAGNLYIADAVNNRVRRVSPDGIITTVAGGNTEGYSGDGGPAIDAELDAPTALATDSAGNLYIAEGVSPRIRKISTNGIITTVAGNGMIGSGGEGGPATSAQLMEPTGIAVDNLGNLYIADEAGGGRISKGSTQGILTRLAGPPDIGGPPVFAHDVFPSAVATDGYGNVYYTDPYNYRVRRIAADGTITTIAGNGSAGYSGDDGPATAAQLSNPAGVAIGAGGRVYIADTAENAIRLLQPVGALVSVAAVTSGASNLAGPVAPGEIVVLYGSLLGPATVSVSQPNGAGNIGTQLAGTSVSFNGTPAPILYTSFTQVAAIVPYEISGPIALVSLSRQGQSSAPLSVALAPAAPALFSLDATGQGQAAAVNEDGSVNSAGYPAPNGSVVSLYATGEGLVSPAGVDGQTAQAPPARPVLPVTVTLGGQTLTPEYAGGVAGETEGLMQIDVRIPAGISPGDSVPVVVSVGGVASQAGVTLAIGPG